MSHTFVIAEIGSCHENGLKNAHLLIDAAREAGADAAKAQFWSSSKALAQRRNVMLAEPVYARFKLPVGWLDILADHCRRVGLEFMCTTYLIKDIPIVAPYVSRFKISAYESKWGDFINAHYEYRREIIVSTNPGNVVCYGDVYRRQGAPSIKRLHCISHYPTKLDDLGLSRIRESGLDGFSDHSANVIAGAQAVAYGATIVEAHIKLDHTLETNPDFQHSLAPDDFYSYVKHIRDAERMQ